MNSRADLVTWIPAKQLFSLLYSLGKRTLIWREDFVLAPIGAGMLGYRVGDEFEWKVPEGVRRMKVMKVHYQPEAAGDFDR